MKPANNILLFVSLFTAISICPLTATAQTDKPKPSQLPDPDDQPADMSKPVKVFILMGQSNMLGFGKVPHLEKAIAAGQYPYLKDSEGNWTVRQDVRNVFIMSGKLKKNHWLTVPSVNNKVGVELAIGHHMGELFDEPVLILKACIGNRSLGWDLLPPSVGTWDYKGKPQPGYGESPATVGQGPADKLSQNWYAGKQYDMDISGAKSILADLETYYPGATGYEVAGFFWWQGDKDMRNPAHFNTYEKHLVALIKDLRKEFQAPKAPFVTASLGQTKKGSTKGDGIILDAMERVASDAYIEELGGNIGFVYTHPLSKGGSSSGHYGGNAETYMNVGEAMGQEMVRQLSEH